MRKKPINLTKKIKRKNRVSNILIALNIMFDAIPMFVIVAMAGMLMNNTMTMRMLIGCSGGITICLVLRALFYGLSIWKAHEAAYEVLTEIRTDLIRHLRKMPIGFFQKRKTGDLTNIINHDVEQVELYLAHALPEIMSATLVPAIIFIIVLLINWQMGLALVCTAPLMILLRKLLNRIWASSMKQYTESTQKMSEDLLEYIATIPVIKAFSREENKTQNLLDGMRNYISWVKRWLIVISIPMSFITMMLEGGLVIMIIVGSILLANGHIDIQKFVLALILGSIFSTSFAKLATFQHYNIVFGRAMATINSVMSVDTPKRSDIYTTIKPGDIVVKDLSFGYSGNKKALSQINLNFKQNSVNAIVGLSGSGKSTLANLIMGFWQPNSGMISIGGKNIADMSEQAHSSLISIVQQDVFLFNLSLEENIRIGNQDATKTAIIEVARRAQIHDLIISLPQGYDTLVGEAGVKFSGGEKQRISIARMMLKNSPIIILDEATAAIDPNNEYLIQQAIGNLGENKTIIMIAHHLNTIEEVDQVIVMDAGKVIATGTHQQLFSSCPQYTEMVSSQYQVDNWKIKEIQA